MRALVGLWVRVREWWSDEPAEEEAPDWEVASRVIAAQYRETLTELEGTKSELEEARSELVGMATKVKEYHSEASEVLEEARAEWDKRGAELVAKVAARDESLSLGSDRIRLLEGLLGDLQPGIDLANLEKFVATTPEGRVVWVGDRMVHPSKVPPPRGGWRSKPTNVRNHRALRRGASVGGGPAPAPVPEGEGSSELRRLLDSARRDASRLTGIPVPEEPSEED